MNHPDIPLRAHRSRPLLRRQRPAVGVLLSQRLRLRRDRLRRPGNARSKHEAGYVLRQGDITFVLASPLRPEHPEAQRLIQHGDGVQDIALEVDDVSAAYRRGRASAGPSASTPPTLLEDEHGVYEYATIRTYGDTTHSFVNRDRYRGVFAPGYQAARPGPLQPAAPSTRSACRPSTTSSATSKKAR